MKMLATEFGSSWAEEEPMVEIVAMMSTKGAALWDIVANMIKPITSP